jgi:ABC-2 type transport system ATP-binding protein
VIAAHTTEIAVTGLSKRFHAPVLRDVALTARGGALTLVLGAPGSGKSTLARCLTGVYRPDTGDVVYRSGVHGAVNLATADPRTVAWLRTHHIAAYDGTLPTAPRLPVAVAAARAARRSRSAAVAALDRLRAADLAPVPIGRLRAAQSRTVAVAAALLAGRPFVVLDEPDATVDADALTGWLRRLLDGGAAIVATGGPDSPLTAIASVTGELTEGNISWHTQ